MLPSLPWPSQCGSWDQFTRGSSARFALRLYYFGKTQRNSRLIHYCHGQHHKGRYGVGYIEAIGLQSFMHDHSHIPCSLRASYFANLTQIFIPSLGRVGYLHPIFVNESLLITTPRLRVLLTYIFSRFQCSLGRDLKRPLPIDVAPINDAAKKFGERPMTRFN